MGFIKSWHSEDNLWRVLTSIYVSPSKVKKKKRNLQLILSWAVEPIQWKFMMEKYYTQLNLNSLLHVLEDVSSFQLVLYSITELTVKLEFSSRS